MVESDYHIAAEAAERQIKSAPQPFLGIYRRLRSRRFARIARNLFVDELSRCRRELEHAVEIGVGGRTAAAALADYLAGVASRQQNGCEKRSKCSFHREFY